MTDRAALIAIGTELTLGQTVDTNSAWLAQRLASFGIRCRSVTLAPDELGPIRAALERAAAESEWVVVTGGLGPTDDDLTRAALAGALGEVLVEDDAALAHLRAFFAQRGRELPEGNERQALRPASAEMLPNPWGTAPGLAARLGAARVFVLPGVPGEMRAMFSDSIAPRLRAEARATVVQRRVNTCGLPESEVGRRLQDLMQRGRNPEVGTTAAYGVIGVRVNAEGSTAAEAAALAEADLREIERRLGDAVFSRDNETLAQAVGRRLVAQGGTLAVAESCTGGMLGAALTDAAGASAYFRGGFLAYDNGLKTALLGVPALVIEQHGAVSVETAALMAVGARKQAEADFALAVSGVAGPDGGTPDKPVGSVCIGLATVHGSGAQRFQFGAETPRDHIRTRAVVAALNWLRRELDGDALTSGR